MNPNLLELTSCPRLMIAMSRLVLYQVEKSISQTLPALAVIVFFVWFKFGGRDGCSSTCVVHGQNGKRIHYQKQRNPSVPEILTTS
jgi:hypothetical protein